MLTDRDRAILREMVARDRLIQRIGEELHPKQRAFALDASKRTAAQAGRRAGKSHALAGKYLMTGVNHPGELSLFVAISAARANEILGAGFSVLGKRIGWQPKATTRSGQLYWIFPNGHRVWVAGCKNRAEAEKFRGSRYAGAAIDECDSMRGHLPYLVEEALDPALLDLDGWLSLTGTPGVTPAGYFWEITTGEGNRRKWPTHHWNALDNPYLPDAAGWLRRRREELGLDENSPTYIREWLGQWVRDLDSLCYPYSPGRNRIEGQLERDPAWRYVLGVDLGVVDATAFVVLAWRDQDPQIHIVESCSFTGLSPSQAGIKVGEFRGRYPGIRIVADTGGQGKAFVAEWAYRYGIRAESAHKLDSRGQICFVADLLRSGSVKVHTPGCDSLIQQWSTLPWNADRSGHDESYLDHEADAARYGMLAIRPLKAIVGVDEPPPGSPAYEAREEAKRRAEAFRGSRR